MGKKKRNKSAQAGGSGAVATEIRQVYPARPQGYSVAQASKPRFFTGTVFEWLAIAATSLLAFWFLTARIVGVQVSVLADEYLYLLDAHYNGLSEAKYPNYLFQWIYSSTKMCGAEFYSCARSINAFFVIFGAVFIYLLAKHIGRSKWLGALAAVAAILGSYGTYTAYFMPEAIFNGLMMVFFWGIIRFGNTDNLFVWVAIGSSLGVASLAKPHGLFVVPAVVIFTLLWTRATKDNWVIPGLVRSAVFVGSVVGAKFLFGYLLAGERALSLFGAYGSLESVAVRTTEAISSTVNNGSMASLWLTGWGQTLMVFLIIGFAAPVMLWGFVQAFTRDPLAFEALRFRALIGISFLNLMAVTAIFEAYYTGDIWMHTRYYSYLIPLAMLAVIEALRRGQQERASIAKKLFGAGAIVVGLINLFTIATPYSSNWIDAPDFRFHINSPMLSQFASAVVIGLIIWWGWKSTAPLILGIVLTSFLSISSGADTTNFLRSNFGTELAYEGIARVLSDFLPQDEVDRTYIFGQNEMAQRTAFSSLSGSIEINGQISETLLKSSVPKDTSWVVVFGDVVHEGFDAAKITGFGYQMFSIDDRNSFVPRSQRITSFTDKCEGLENDGWACGEQTNISLDKALPENANVNLIFELPGNASTTEIEFVLGDATAVATFPAGIVSMNVKFSNSMPSDTLLIRRKTSSQSNDKNLFVRPVWGHVQTLP